MAVSPVVIPRLETERFILRGHTLEDFPASLAMWGDPAVTKHIGGRPFTADEVWARVLRYHGHWALLGYGMFSVIEKASGKWIGRLGPWRPAEWPGTEVGWGLVREVQGKGYATEGASAAMDWAVDHLGWTNIIHCIDPQNAPSQKVAQRLGSKNRGPGKMPPPYEDAPIEIWGQTAAEWKARRR